MDAPVPLQTVAAGLNQPTMWLTRPPDTMRLERERIGGWSEAEIKAHHVTMRATFESLRAPGYFVEVPDDSHLDFTDVPSWSPAFRWLRVTGPRDGKYAHRVINDYSLNFFDRHLLGKPGSLLDVPSTTYPDVTIDRHHPRWPPESSHEATGHALDRVGRDAAMTPDGSIRRLVEHVPSSCAPKAGPTGAWRRVGLRQPGARSSRRGSKALRTSGSWPKDSVWPVWT